MSNFIRGGQVTAHKIRMALQVVRIIIRFALCIMLLTVVITYKSNISGYEWGMIPAMVKQYIFQDINPDSNITYTNKRGTVVKEKAKYLKWNRDFRDVEKKYSYVFWLSIKRLVWVICFSLIFSMLYFWFRGFNLQTNKKMRGVFLIPDFELRNSIIRHNKKFSGIKSYSIAGIPYAATGRKNSYTPGEQAHTLVLGSTESGKTKVIQDLVRQLDERCDKAIIVDIKGDYIASFYDESRGDIILNPVDKRGVNWNFFQETDELKGFDTIAQTIIPDSQDMFWSQSARVIFCELAMYYQDKVSTLAEFVDIITKQDIKELEKILAGTSAAKLVNQDADKTVACVLMNLSTYLRPLKLYNKTGDVFSITDWVNDSKKSNFLFISTSSDMRGNINFLLQMQVDLAINALCSTRNISQKKIWFILDEIAFFDKGLPNLKDGLTTSRSFGGAFVLGVQDMSSLSKIYGFELSRVIANNCRNKFIMNVDDPNTAQWCSNLFGEGEIEEWREGLSYGAHEMRDGISSNKSKILKKVFLPSEFSQLKTGEGYIKIPGFNPALIKFKEVYISNNVKGFIPDRHLMNKLKVSDFSKQTKKQKSDQEKKKEGDNKSNKNPSNDKKTSTAENKKNNASTPEDVQEKKIKNLEIENNPLNDKDKSRGRFL